MTTNTDRIAVLERELAALKATEPLVDLPRPQPVDPADRPGPRIVLLQEQTKFVKPTAGELRELYTIVIGRYSRLGAFRDVTNPIGSVSPDEHFTGFTSAFERLGFIGRAPQPDTKHYVSHWATEAQDWLKVHRPGYHGAVGGGFLAAVLAHGDIPYIVGDGARGVVWSIGLTTYGGTMAADKWKRVLEGQLMTPVMPARRYA
jgi:hypothetical protein